MGALNALSLLLALAVVLGLGYAKTPAPTGPRSRHSRSGRP